MEKMVPIETLTSMFMDPSSGSYSTTYLPAAFPGGTGTGSGSSSDAVTHTRPVCWTLLRTVSFAMPVRGKGDRTAPIGPENRDAVSRQPLEDLGGGVPVVVVPTDADHGLARRELVQPLVRRRGPRPVMTDLQEVDAPHLPG